MAQAESAEDLQEEALSMEALGGLLIIIAALYVIFHAFATAHVAQTKGREAGAWFILGLFFGVFALMAVGFCETQEEAERQKQIRKERQAKEDAKLIS